MIHPIKAPRYGTVRWDQRDVQREQPMMGWAADEISYVLRQGPCGLNHATWTLLGVLAGGGFLAWLISMI